MNRTDFLNDIHSSTKTYKTEAGAVKAIEKEIGQYEVMINYFIYPTPEGRFIPVVLFGPHNQQQAIWCAHSGFKVLGS